MQFILRNEVAIVIKATAFLSQNVTLTHMNMSLVHTIGDTMLQIW